MTYIEYTIPKTDEEVLDFFKRRREAECAAREPTDDEIFSDQFNFTPYNRDFFIRKHGEGFPE